MIETTKQETIARRVIAVAEKIVAVQDSLSAFDFEDQQYLPKVVAQAILETEYSFAHGDYDRAGYMAKVTAFLVNRGAHAQILRDGLHAGKTCKCPRHARHGR
jgi:hypothetical protein